MKIKKYAISIVAIILFMTVSQVANAAENQLVFTPTIKQTKDKLDDSKTDIKLKVHAGETTTVLVEVTNESSKAQMLTTKILNAKTNSQGNINYTSEGNNLEKAISLSQIANYSEQLKIGGKETKEIKVDLKIPEKKFPGIIMGGLLIQQEADESEGMIKNAFSFSIPVILVEDERNIDANLKFSEVLPELSGGKNAFKITLDNPVNNILPEADLHLDITEKGAEESLYSDDIEEMSFAPNMSFDHFVLMGTDGYKPGEYTAHISVKSPYGDWNWDEDFKIEDKIAKELNKKSVSVQRMSPLVKVMIGLIVLLLIILAVVFFIMKKKLNRQNQ